MRQSKAGQWQTIACLVSALALAAAILAGCGANSSDASSARPTTSGAIVIIQIGDASSNFTFNPDNVTVKVGTSVRWVNQANLPHTVTSDAGAPLAWDSPVLQTGAHFDLTLTTPGTYHYHCALHATMKATLIVTP
jgi:plastocyanin